MSIIAGEVKLQKSTQETLDLYRARRKNSMDIVRRLIKTLPKEVLLQAEKKLGLSHKKALQWKLASLWIFYLITLFSTICTIIKNHRTLCI